MAIQNLDQQARQLAIQHTLKRLYWLVFAMLLFSAALVPLYDVFCDITGLNGKAQDRALSAQQLQNISATSSSLTPGVSDEQAVQLRFVNRIGAGLPLSLL